MVPPLPVELATQNPSSMSRPPRPSTGRKAAAGDKRSRSRSRSLWAAQTARLLGQVVQPEGAEQANIAAEVACARTQAQSGLGHRVAMHRHEHKAGMRAHRRRTRRSSARGEREGKRGERQKASREKPRTRVASDMHTEAQPRCEWQQPAAQDAPSRAEMSRAGLAEQSEDEPSRPRCGVEPPSSDPVARLQAPAATTFPRQ